MRYALSLLLLLSFSTLFAGDQPPAAPLPVDVQKVVDDRQAALDKAKAAFDAATVKATSEAIVKLEKVVKDTTKKGDLAGALAVQKVIDEYKASLPDLLGSKPAPVKSEFAGKWVITGLKHSGTTVNLKDDKTADFGDRVGFGTWTQGDDGVTITWKNGFSYKITKKGDSLSFVEQKGDAVISDGKLVR